MNKTLPALFTLALLSGCVVYKDAPIVDNGPPAVEGTPVALRQPGQAGPVVATPMTGVEDSRCPRKVQCIQAGQVRVRASVRTPSGEHQRTLTLGQPRLRPAWRRIPRRSAARAGPAAGRG